MLLNEITKKKLQILERNLMDYTLFGKVQFNKTTTKNALKNALPCVFNSHSAISYKTINGITLFPFYDVFTENTEGAFKSDIFSNILKVMQIFRETRSINVRRYNKIWKERGINLLSQKQCEILFKSVTLFLFTTGKSEIVFFEKSPLQHG